MAANKFATMLSRNTNKITLILIYAVLEWILIVLLLLNSLFSYLIFRFADFFGLKPPCPWCTRIDHVFDAAKGGKNLHRAHLCEIHAKEVSGLGFCLNHRKLVESRDMCEDCLSSRPEFEGLSKNFALFPWTKEFGLAQEGKEMAGENGEVSLNCCSCCGVSLDCNKYASYILLKTSSWDVLECAHKENLIVEDGNHIQKEFDSDDKISSGLGDDEMIMVEKIENRESSEFDGILEVIEEETKENGSCDPQRVDENVGAVLEVEDDKETLKEETSALVMVDKSVQVCVVEDAHHLEFFLDSSGNTLVPIELVDSVAEGLNNERNSNFDDEEEKTKDQEFLGPDSEVQVDLKEEVVVENGTTTKLDTFDDLDINEEPKYPMLDSMELEEDDNSLVFHAKGLHMVMNEHENFVGSPLARWPSQEASVTLKLTGGQEEEHSDVHTDNVGSPLARWPSQEASVTLKLTGGQEEERSDVHSGSPLAQWPSQQASVTLKLTGGQEGELSDVHTDNVACEEVAQANNEHDAEVSIGTEIPDLDIINEMQIHDSVHSNDCIHEVLSSNPVDVSTEQEDRGNFGVQAVELQPLSVQDRDHRPNNEPTFELGEVEEDKAPDTPTSVDSLNQLHKKLQMLGKRDSGTEESIDGSVTSELEGSDGVVTIERLKSALRSERKALQVLYAELEQERSASAVATNQTMAMINRLQEEKAAMQMEALQYQRMMDEQSEYDQEALQLLNELMVKREKEKQELERELDGYKKKLFEYEIKEKTMLFKRSKEGSTRSGNSSASYSNADDSDGLSIDLNQGAKEDEGSYTDYNAPVAAIVNLEESLADFEEERLSILEQLKVLEEKLLTLDDDKENLNDVNVIDENGDLPEENVHLNGETNGHVKDFPSEIKHHQQRRITVQKGKSLLPLFDAISDENGHVTPSENTVDSNGVLYDTQNKKLAIEEEVDHLYERLQALEADREFLKHCITSLKKGDKGIDLLQEILHHLRDLRSVELRVRNLSDAAII